MNVYTIVYRRWLYGNPPAPVFRPASGNADWFLLPEQRTTVLADNALEAAEAVRLKHARIEIVDILPGTKIDLVACAT